MRFKKSKGVFYYGISTSKFYFSKFKKNSFNECNITG